jgi:hypothetical protein
MTEAPPWLDIHWQHSAQESLRTGSLEERAEHIMRIVHAEKDKLDRDKTIKPNELKALALDLAVAAAEHRNWLEPVGRLLALAVKLPGYAPGSWLPLDLDRRGRDKVSDEAWYYAALFDAACYRTYGKVKSQHALARDLRSQGFKTLQRRIGEWRRKAYGCKPGETGYVPPDAPTMSREEERKVPPLPEWRIEILK